MTVLNNMIQMQKTEREREPLIAGMRILWHDLHLLITGPATQNLRLHFAQRWIYAFSRNTPLTRSQTITIPSQEHRKPCGKNHEVVGDTGNKVYQNCPIKVLRVWKGVFDTHYMLHEYMEMIKNAKSFLYIEHQYPFHNYPLTHVMCQALKRNPQLRVLIVTPVKTDLLTGLAGELVDWSQDHIIQHLHTIKKAAPDRVGIYGIVKQDPSSQRIKPIYVHSKLCIVDDEYIITGSTNLDNMSFFYSSELSLTIYNAQLAKDMKTRLIKEHLGRYYKPEMEDDFQMIFDAFKKVASMNDKCLCAGIDLVGRPVFMAPAQNYELVLQRIYYPNKVSKLLYKMGINTEDFLQDIADSGRGYYESVKKLPLLRSYL